MKILLLTCPRGDGTAYNHVYSSLSEEAKGQVLHYLQPHFSEIPLDILNETLQEVNDTEETEFVNSKGKWICSLVWQEINEEP